MKKILARLIGLYLNLLALLSPRKAGQKGFELFCSPQKSPLKNHQLDYLKTAAPFTFESDGSTIQGFKWGSGPKKVLFVHGWQSHSFRWKNYIESFSKEDYTLYAIDAPAHGQSGGRFLNLVIYSQAIEKFFHHVGPVETVISHSLGSFAMIYTHHRLGILPVKQLVVTGVPGEVDEFIQYFMNVLGLWPNTMKAIDAAFLERIKGIPKDFSAKKFAQGMSLPGLIIHDEHDLETPYKHALDIHAAWKNSKLITTRGLGHNLRSATVIKHIVEFVDQPVDDLRKSA